MKHILLEPGDTVKIGDEYWSEGMGLWDEITGNIIHWWGPDHKYDGTGWPVRRKVSVPEKVRKRPAAKATFEKSPRGPQLYAGEWRGGHVWYSDDGGKFWWSGHIFSHSAQVTREELIDLAVSILQAVK